MPLVSCTSRDCKMCAIMRKVESTTWVVAKILGNKWRRVRGDCVPQLPGRAHQALVQINLDHVTVSRHFIKSLLTVFLDQRLYISASILRRCDAHEEVTIDVSRDLDPIDNRVAARTVEFNGISVIRFLQRL